MSQSNPAPLAVVIRKRGVISVAAVLGGLMIGNGLARILFYSSLVIHSAVSPTTPIPWAFLEVTRPAGFVFAGFVAATFARGSKIGHAVAVGVSVWLWGSLAWIQAPSLASAIPWVLPIPSAWLGGMLERWMTARLRARHPQREWEYHTASGRSIRALAPWNFPVAARIWQGAAVLLVVQGLMESAGAAGFLWLLLPHISLASFFPLILLVIGIISSLSVGLACWWIARRQTAPSVDEALARDPRPPVVFLRPFDDDGKQLEGEGIWYEFRHSLKALFRKSKEQRLEKILKGIGPLVAIGRPGEELAELGAARMYVSDDDWQTVVDDLLGRAAAVVLQAGQSPGLQWEVERAVSLVPPSRVLLFLPFRLVRRSRREAMYGNFLSWAQGFFPSPLPPQLGRSFFISFQDSPAWEATALARRAKSLPDTPLGRALRAFSRDGSFHPISGIWRTLGLLTVIVAGTVLIGALILRAI